MMAPAPLMPRPSPEQVAAYAAGLNYEGFDAEAFVDYWETRGWMIRPGIPMRKWQPAVRTWQRNQRRWAAEKTGAAPLAADPATTAAIADYAAQAAAIIRNRKGEGIGRLYDKIRDTLGPAALDEVRRRAKSPLDNPRAPVPSCTRLPDQEKHRGPQRAAR